MFLALFLNLILDTRSILVYCILGGTDIMINEAPYQVNYGDICGGVLIDRKWAITTAHCGKEDFIRVGYTNRVEGPRIKIANHIVHPKYGKKHKFDYDIQLLHLRRSLRIDDNVKPIKISDGEIGNYIYVAGWGYPKERGEYLENLQQVKLTLLPFKYCQQIKQQWYNNTLTRRMFCAEGTNKRDACQGDSGGGAVSQGKLVGLSSFGYGCGRNYPGVYLNVTEQTIRDWIYNYTGI